MIRQGQAMMEFVLTFIIVAALIMGLLSLWRWSKDQIPARQGWYDGSRISAGTETIHGTGTTEVYSGAAPPGEPSYL